MEHKSFDFGSIENDGQQTTSLDDDFFASLNKRGEVAQQNAQQSAINSDFEAAKAAAEAQARAEAEAKAAAEAAAKAAAEIERQQAELIAKAQAEAEAAARAAEEQARRAEIEAAEQRKLLEKAKEEAEARAKAEAEAAAKREAELKARVEAERKAKAEAAAKAKAEAEAAAKEAEAAKKREAEEAKAAAEAKKKAEAEAKIAAVEAEKRRIEEAKAAKKASGAIQPVQILIALFFVFDFMVVAYLGSALLFKVGPFAKSEESGANSDIVLELTDDLKTATVGVDYNPAAYAVAIEKDSSYVIYYKDSDNTVYRIEGTYDASLTNYEKSQAAIAATKSAESKKGTGEKVATDVVSLYVDNSEAASGIIKIYVREDGLGLLESKVSVGTLANLHGNA